ncbi:hypothetical protein [uncultured Polaribacter sp.]|uniref:hypothetical protein n=1 Tax=uncultured Polaribacter sp. TaxID=174711 RepID=UPI002629BF4B|nr:hypothetical protein [uncultured Polaribacter sp.]
MIQIVEEYTKYVHKIPELISKTDYKASYFIKLLNLKAPTYYRKLRENAFTIDEINILTKALYPKESYKNELLKSIENGRNDFKNGNILTSEEMKTQMREKILSHK